MAASLTLSVERAGTYHVLVVVVVVVVVVGVGVGVVVVTLNIKSKQTCYGHYQPILDSTIAAC